MDNRRLAGKKDYEKMQSEKRKKNCRILCLSITIPGRDKTSLQVFYPPGS